MAVSQGNRFGRQLLITKDSSVLSWLLLMRMAPLLGYWIYSLLPPITKSVGGQGHSSAKTYLNILSQGPQNVRQASSKGLLDVTKYP